MRNKPFITLPTLRGVALVDINNLIYICSDGRNCTFYLENNQCKTVNVSISNVEEILKDSNFVRCHQQCIVNVLKIEEIFTGSSGLLLTSGKEFNITRTYKEKFRKKMKKYCY
ncbi:MAG: LytTR family transcriptional regulator [Chloroflexia bacterium]|nr:LytTR family transcriptional regulator [Chloroflexia bacterium]